MAKDTIQDVRTDPDCLIAPAVLEQLGHDPVYVSERIVFGYLGHG